MNIEEHLQAPFPASDIEWRVQQADKNKKGTPWALVLAYVTNRAVQTRLDEVFGAGGWQNDFKPTPNGNGTMCGISAKINSEWITKWDGAEDTATEATKGGLSSSMKRAAVQWGIGRYLYNLDTTFADIQDEKNLKTGYTEMTKLKSGGIAFWKIPTLPAWALPEVEITEESVKKRIMLAKKSGVSDELTRLWDSQIYTRGPREVNEAINSYIKTKSP